MVALHDGFIHTRRWCAPNKVCAGISNSRIVLWHYLPNKWNGELAAATYEGLIIACLRAERGAKRKYRVLEDNDPTGYKSNKAIDEKKKLHIEAVTFPTYSPDLNPLDYSIWEAVEAYICIAEMVCVRSFEWLYGW